MMTSVPLSGSILPPSYTGVFTLYATPPTGSTPGALSVQYAGHYSDGLRCGPGTQYFPDGSMYSGQWNEDKPHGKGTMRYKDGTEYVGEWQMGKRQGMGTLLKPNGDVFRGEWGNDTREGRGQMYYKRIGKMFDGEWVRDMPKCGVYVKSDGTEEETVNPLMPKKKFAPLRVELEIPELGLKDPEKVLMKEISNIRMAREAARSIPYIALSDLFNESELDGLRALFGSRDPKDLGQIDAKEMFGLLEQLNLPVAPADSDQVLIDLGLSKESKMTFVHFVKALYLVQAAIVKENTKIDFSTPTTPEINDTGRYSLSSETENVE